MTVQKSYPKGPLGSYLCDITLATLLITCQFLFCGTKKVNRIFYRVKQNLIFLSFLWSIFLFPFFLCSFIIPFTEDSVILIKSIFSFLLFLFVDLRHMFSRLLSIITKVVFSLKVVDNHSKYLFCYFCSRLSTDLICNNWTRTWDLADKRRHYCVRRSTVEKKLTKKRKLSTLLGLTTTLFLHGSTTPHGFTALGKTHLGGNILGVKAPIVCPPGSSHQSLFTRHQSASAGTSQPGTR